MPRQKSRKPTQKKGTPATPNGILVTLTPGEDGGREMQIQPLGDVKVTELPTLLGMAKNAAERELGV